MGPDRVRGGNLVQGQIQLFVRDMAQLDARPLAGSREGSPAVLLA
jgi:hypothetical protein